MVCRMPFLDGNKQAAAGRTNLAFSLQRKRNSNPVLKHFGGFCIHRQRCTEGRRAPELYIVRGSDSARWFLKPLSVHDRNGCSPISVTIQQGADDATVDHPRKRLVVIRWDKFHDQPVLGAKRINFQPVFVCWTTSKTN